MEKEVKENVKEEVKEEVKNNKETATKNTNKTTKEKGKKSGVLVVIVVLLIIAGVAAYIVLNMLNNPEELAKKYVEAMNEGSVDKIIEMYDAKGAVALEKCDKDVSKFQEEYKKVSDEDTNSKKDSIKKQMDGAISMLKLLGGLKMELVNVEKPENLGSGLYKLTANVKMSMGDQSENQPLKLLVYNGKFVGDAAE